LDVLAELGEFFTATYQVLAIRASTASTSSRKIQNTPNIFVNNLILYKCILANRNRLLEAIRPCCALKTTKTVNFIELITICIAQHHSATTIQDINAIE
jgi:hypothetical protein